jgi:hypothetical protein
MAIIRLVVVLFTCLGLWGEEINAFAPKLFALKPLVKKTTLSSRAFQQQQQLYAFPSDLLFDETTTASFSSLSVASLGDLLQSASVMFGGLLVLLIGFFVYFQSFITSNAAAQLETQARTEYPDLWSDYQAQLNLVKGETLKSRPDLVLSLRNQIQAREFQALQKRSNASLEDYNKGSSNPSN